MHMLGTIADGVSHPLAHLGGRPGRGSLREFDGLGECTLLHTPPKCRAGKREQTGRVRLGIADQLLFSQESGVLKKVGEFIRSHR